MAIEQGKGGGFEPGEASAGFDPLGWIDEEARERASKGLTRRLVEYGESRGGMLEASGRWYVNFGSNDYLGLASDERVVSAACEAARRYGWGAGASPLVTGWREPHQALVEALAEFEGVEAAALFPSGFAANLGAVAALVGAGDAVYCDRLNHACLVAGARASGARLRVYPHGDAGALAKVLERERGLYRRVLIATDGVFSMDGDLAPLAELVEVAERFGAMFVVDEAHGTGVFGERGRGAAEAHGVEARVAVRVGTLSKAVGSVGGFVAGSRLLIDHLMNRAGSLVYSTGLPPAAAAASLAGLQVVREEPERRRRLHEVGDWLRGELRSRGWKVVESRGPIVPVIVGEPGRAVAISQALKEGGFLVPAIRPPTVPSGTSRLRISLSAAHTREDVEGLVAAMGREAGG